MLKKKQQTSIEQLIILIKLFIQVQYEQNNGKCGVCGDPWNGSRPNEPPGKFANGIIVRKYSPGEIITVVIELTANHKGWMEFKLCPNDDWRKRVTQECLDSHVLALADTTLRRYRVPNKNGYQKIRVRLVLPENIRCKSCVFQWKYNAGNSWGTDKLTGRGCVGCGNQEQFYGCADIAIGYDDVEIPTHTVPLPADRTDDDEEIDFSDMPNVDEWHWTARPNLSPGSDGNVQTIRSGSKTFSFMPVMNQNGMNPCMCICKRAPLKLNTKGSDLEANFFKGIEGEDNQVCMCMCQNSAERSSISMLGVVLIILITRCVARMLGH